MLTALVFYNNWLVGAVGTDYGFGAASLASGGFIVGLSMLLNRDALEAILNPATRWWMTPMRRRMQLPVRFKLLSRKRTPRKSEDVFDEFYVRTFDLSEGGVFIPVEQVGMLSGTPEARSLQIFGTIARNLAIGTQCYVCLPLKDVELYPVPRGDRAQYAGSGRIPGGGGAEVFGPESGRATETAELPE